MSKCVEKGCVPWTCAEVIDVEDGVTPESEPVKCMRHEFKPAAKKWLGIELETEADNPNNPNAAAGKSHG